MSPAAQQAVAEISALPGVGKLTPSDVQDIVDAAAQPNATQIIKILVADYQTSGAMPVKEWWQATLAIIVKIGGELLPLVGPVKDVIGMFA